MKTQYYAAASLDGFIATEDHDLGWLLRLGDPEETSYPAFIREVGAIAMGSATFEWLLRHRDEVRAATGKDEAWPYEQPVWVFTTRTLPAVPGADLRFVRGDVRPVHREMVEAAGGKNVWIVGGGELAGRFHDHGLLNELIVQVTPVTLGGGRPLLPRRITSPPLELLSAERFGVFAELRYALPGSGRPAPSREARDREVRDREVRDREVHDREVRDREVRGREVRDAREAEVGRLAKLWFDGWQDAHAAILPAELARLRTLESFEERLRALLPQVRVAGPPGEPIGCSMLQGSELYQLYVAAEARGAGVAAALTADAEARLAERGVETAWLACAIGNERAARFYEKSGWHRTGTMVSRLETPEGTFPLEVWRYEKRLRPPGGHGPRRPGDG